MADEAPLIGIIMGSRSDWETMRHAAETLDALGVAYETKVVSAHRTPERLYDYAKSAAGRGLKVIIAGAGGAAHLPGMAASMTRLPVLGVPVETKALAGLDSLLSIVQMPAGVPVGHAGDRQGGRDQCRPARRRDPRHRRRGAGRRGSRPGGRARPTASPNRPNDRPARLHHRHRRRRPTRADAGAGGGAARLSLPRLRARRRTAPRRRGRRRASPGARSTTRRRWRASPPRSTSSPTSSRISPAAPLAALAARVPLYPPRRGAGNRAGPARREGLRPAPSAAAPAPFARGRRPGRARRRAGRDRRARDPQDPALRL